MFIVFSSASVTRAQRHPAMSTRKGNRVVADTVVRRRPEEVVAEMAEIAKEEKARMAAQAAQALQMPPCLEKVKWSRLRPIRLIKPINPIPPPSPEEVVVAAVKRREFEAEEAQAIEGARRLFNSPRSPTPPRGNDDPYDLARWAFRSGR